MYLVKAFDTFNNALLIAILGKYGAPPRRRLSIKTHVLQKHSQAHHWQGGDIHRLKSDFQTRRKHSPGIISVLNDGL